MAKKKQQIVELSDLLDDDSLIGKTVEVRNLIVGEYNRGELGTEPEDPFPSYDGIVKKEGKQIRFEGKEDGIGIDITYIHSQKFGHEIDIKGQVLSDRKGTKYVRVIDVLWSSWR
ncbi:MAG: hypothetical protein AABW48_03055 [Nanoarchaeota archaeon]